LTVINTSTLDLTPIMTSSKIRLENTKPDKTLNILSKIKYVIAIYQPKRIQSMKIITGFINGEAIKKLIEGPNGTFEFNNPASIGIVEQEQNGVTAPKNVPSI